MEKEFSFFKSLSSISKNVSLFALMAFISGFFIWNYYLYRIGFAEHQIIQTKFIATGVLFLILASIIYYPLNRFYNFLLFKISRKIKAAKKLYFDMTVFGLIFYILAMIVYAHNYFYYIPNYMGGAEPRILSIIASQEEIEHLAEFDIKAVGPTQTEPLCVAYENSKSIIIFRDDRIMSINKEDIKGFVSLPNQKNKQFEEACGKYTRDWLSGN